MQVKLPQTVLIPLLVLVPVQGRCVCSFGRSVCVRDPSSSSELSAFHLLWSTPLSGPDDLRVQLHPDRVRQKPVWVFYLDWSSQKPTCPCYHGYSCSVFMCFTWKHFYTRSVRCFFSGTQTRPLCGLSLFCPGGSLSCPLRPRPPTCS